MACGPPGMTTSLSVDRPEENDEQVGSGNRSFATEPVSSVEITEDSDVFSE